MILYKIYSLQSFMLYHEHGGSGLLRKVGTYLLTTQHHTPEDYQLGTDHNYNLKTQHCIS
jgi:hypothetical protein